MRIKFKTQIYMTLIPIISIVGGSLLLVILVTTKPKAYKIQSKHTSNILINKNVPKIH